MEGAGREERGVGRGDRERRGEWRGGRGQRGERGGKGQSGESANGEGGSQRPGEFELIEFYCQNI